MIWLPGHSQRDDGIGRPAGTVSEPRPLAPHQPCSPPKPACARQSSSQGRTMLPRTVLTLRRPPQGLVIPLRPIVPRYLSLPAALRVGLGLGQRTSRPLQPPPPPSFPLTSARQNTTASVTSEAVSEPIPNPRSTTVANTKDYVYRGPLTNTFRRLKIFSLSSLVWGFVVSPLMFILDGVSGLPMVARISLVAFAFTTSGVSTALIAWCGKPYVSSLRFIPPPPGIPEDGIHRSSIVEMTTFTLALHPRITTIYDTAFLIPTNRPFAKFELAEAFRLPPAEVESEQLKGNLPRDETVAETRDKKGNVVGRWVVQWDEKGQGTCYEIGTVSRYALCS